MSKKSHSLKIKHASLIHTHAVNGDNREKLKLPILIPLKLLNNQKNKW